MVHSSKEGGNALVVQHYRQGLPLNECENNIIIFYRGPSATQEVYHLLLSVRHMENPRSTVVNPV